MTLQIVFLFVLWLVAGFMFARAWARPEREVNSDLDASATIEAVRAHPYEQLGQKAP